MNTVVKLKELLTSEYDFKVTKTRNFLKLVKEDYDTYTIYVKHIHICIYMYIYIYIYT